MENGRTCFTVKTPKEMISLSLGVPGLHNVMNALAALAAADVLGVPLALAAGKLSEFSGFARRLQIVDRNGLTLIDDSYNASPESMRAALQVLSATETAGRRGAVLADMLELGPDSPKFHGQVGEYAARCPVDQYFLIGAQIRFLGEALEKAGKPVLYFTDNAAAAAAVKDWAKPGDTVLFKGSNGMKLGEVLKEL